MAASMHRISAECISTVLRHLSNLIPKWCGRSKEGAHLLGQKRSGSFRAYVAPPIEMSAKVAA